MHLVQMIDSLARERERVYYDSEEEIMNVIKIRRSLLWVSSKSGASDWINELEQV